MVRPKKARFIDGVQLEENLYPDTRGRSGHFRYLRPDGTFRYFQAESVHQANAAAKQANENRDEYVPKERARTGLTMMGGYVEDFIESREIDSSELKTKESWKIRKTVMRQFGREITLPFSRLTRRHITDWWSGLTYHQRKTRHAEFRKLFNYLMGRGVLPGFDYNPFTTADDRPRLYSGEKPARVRQRLDQSGFWAIYHKAAELGFDGLQIAMGLSLVTFMREQDILALRVPAGDEDGLRKVISKSEAQRGHTAADRRQWSGQHRLVQKFVQRGRELSMRNGRCPFLISHRPKRKAKSEQKEHFSQLTKYRLAEQFREARDATKLWADLPAEQRPTFHEIRSLADALARQAGFDLKTIQHAMAHSDEAMTLMYQGNHDLPFEEVGVVFTEKMIGGSF